MDGRKQRTKERLKTMNAEELKDYVWTRDPVCSCTGDGNPVMLEGEMVIFRSLGCRKHTAPLSVTTKPLSAETIVGNWNGREREK